MVTTRAQQHDLKEEEQKRCKRGCLCRSDLTGSSPVCGVCARSLSPEISLSCVVMHVANLHAYVFYVIHSIKYGLFTGSSVHSAIKSDCVVTLCCIFQDRPDEFVAAGDQESFISTQI